MKKSLFTLFTSLIVCGLLLVWSANAMKYTIDIDAGSQTKVWFPVNSVYGSILINRWDWYSSEVTTCETGFYYGQETYLCTKMYGESNNYNIEITNSSDFSPNFIYLENAKVKNWINFNWFLWDKIIYLSNNNIENLPNNIFSNLTATPAIFLDYNNLWNFDFDWLSLSNIHTLSLRHNGLRTIPNWIWNSDTRKYFNIKITGEIIIPSTNSSDKLIDLSENNINFVWITKIDNTDDMRYIDGSLTYKFLGVPNNGYYFERFGYSYNTESIIYKYQILEGNVSVDEGTNNSTGAIITQKLAPGNYTFKVCYNEWNDDNNSEHCDEVNFAVDYDEDIIITSPVDNQEFSSLNDIQWEWWRSWVYPEELLSWYEYRISKDWSYTSWFVYLSDLDECNGYYDCTYLNIGNVISNEWNGNLNWEYTITIYLKDKDWYVRDLNNYIYSSKNFTIAINNEIVISQPTWITGSRTDSINPHFEWSSASSIFDHYIYYITEGNSCSDAKILSDTVEDNRNPSIDNISLWNGTYTLCVDMFDRYSNKINSEPTSLSFNVYIPAEIRITNPNNYSDITTIFEWNKFLPSNHNFTKYEYSVTSTNWYSYTNSTANQNETWFNLDNLWSGNYTFNVKMFYNETQYTGATKTFTRNIDNANVEITIPGDLSTISATNTTEKEVLFKWDWNGTLFSKYHYTLKDSSEIELTWWDVTINNSDSRQFKYILWNGTYTFEVKMYDSSDNVIASDASTFTVEIPTTLNIISPTSGNHSSAITTFSWEWFTPYTFTDYEYTITWPNWFSIWPTTTGSTSFSLQNLHDGSYTFSLTMNYKEWSTPKTITKTRGFTINSSAWANIEITSPNEPIYTWNYKKNVQMNFTWNWWGSELTSRYSYRLINTINNEIIVSGYVDKNESWAYFVDFILLPSGTYRFEVTMLDSDDAPIIPTVSRTFNVVIPSYLEIHTPPEWQLNIKNVDFAWSGFAEFEDHYKYEVNRVDNQGNIISTIESWNNVPLSTKSFSLQNLHNGKYTFTVSIMDGDDFEIISGSRTFRIPDDLDLILDISDWNSSETTLRSRKWIFSRWWKSEDFAGYSYSIQGTTFKNESYLYTWTSEWITTGSITLNNLSTWKYRFYVKMLNASGWIITWKYIDFDVVIPATLKIVSPVSWSTVNSSNVTFKWDWYSDVITRYEYSLISSWWYNYNWFTTVDSFTRNDLVNWDYTLVVRLASGANFVAEDTIHFTVDIPKKTSWGGWWSSSKSHPTNDLSVSIANESPNTNERIEVKVDVKDKYTWKVDFSKMQYYSGWEWIDIPVTSKNYVSDYSDDAKLWYVNFSSSDNWEKELSEFLKISKKGNYRIYAEDKDWYIDYVQFYVWNWWNNTVRTTTARVDSKPTDTEDEVYIARSCKKYKITYSDSLNVYTSPNLNMSEYFMSKDYFKRYVDSKNRYQNWCPTNVWWISTSYSDKTNDNSRYTAPNWKVYFITWKEWNYYSNELNKELRTPTSFGTIQQLKYYIRDRNPLINMATLWPVK